MSLTTALLYDKIKVCSSKLVLAKFNSSNLKLRKMFLIEKRAPRVIRRSRVRGIGAGSLGCGDCTREFVNPVRGDQVNWCYLRAASTCSNIDQVVTTKQTLVL